MQLNHPNTIRKEVPRLMDRRISEVSSNKEKFDKAKGICEKAFKVTLNFTEEKIEINNRNEKII